MRCPHCGATLSLHAQVDDEDDDFVEDLAQDLAEERAERGVEDLEEE